MSGCDKDSETLNCESLNTLVSELRSARGRNSAEPERENVSWVDELVAAVTDFLSPNAGQANKAEQAKPTAESLAQLTTRASEALMRNALDEAALHLSTALPLAKDEARQDVDALKSYAQAVRKLKAMRAAKRESTGVLGDLLSLSQPAADGVKLSARADGPRKVLGRAAPNTKA